MKKYYNIMIFTISVFVLAALDQISKVFATNALKGNSSIPIWNDILELYYLENTGTAWGLFGGARIFFIIITTIIFLVIVFFIYRLPFTKRNIPLLLNAILLGSGAIGNFIDRMVLGYVRDFIYFKLINFPIFNIADIYVTVGIGLFAILIFFVYKDEELTSIIKPQKNGGTKTYE